MMMKTVFAAMLAFGSIFGSAQAQSEEFDLKTKVYAAASSQSAETDSPDQESGLLETILLNAAAEIVKQNFEAAKNERGELDKILRATTGISVRDIERYGIFGGPNSLFRKPLG